jgi:hypothetical protein
MLLGERVNPRRSENSTVGEQLGTDGRLALASGEHIIHQRLGQESGEHVADPFLLEILQPLARAPRSLPGAEDAGSNGLGRKSSRRPRCGARCCPCRRRRDHDRRDVAGAGSCFRRSSTSIPLRPGITMSSRTTSAGSAARAAGAAEPSSAILVVCPSRSGSRSERRGSRSRRHDQDVPTDPAHRPLSLASPERCRPGHQVRTALSVPVPCTATQRVEGLRPSPPAWFGDDLPQLVGLVAQPP